MDLRVLATDFATYVVALPMPNLLSPSDSADWTTSHKQPEEWRADCLIQEPVGPGNTIEPLFQGASHLRRNPVRKLSLLPMACMVSMLAFGQTGSQPVEGPTTVRTDVHHDVSPPLRDLIKNAPPPSLAMEEAEPVGRIPLPPGLVPLEEDPVRQ